MEFIKINPQEYERRTSNGTYLIRNDAAFGNGSKGWSLWLDGEVIESGAKTKKELVKISMEHWRE